MALEVQTVVNNAHEYPITCVSLNRARCELYSGAQDNLVKVWCSETGRLLRIQQGHKGWVSDLLFVPHVKLLFSGSVDGTVLAWSDRGHHLQTVDFGGAVFCFAWNTKRHNLVVGGNGNISMFKVTRPDAYQLNALGKSSYGKEGESGGIKVLKFLATVRNHSDLIKGLACSDNGRIFSAGYDKAICMYDSERPKEVCVKFEKCHSGAICSLAFDADNNWIVTGSYDGTVKIWSQEGRCLDVFDGLADTVTGLACVSATKSYWVTGRGYRLVAYDPRSPANITEYVKDTSRLDEFQITKLHQVPLSDNVVGVTSDRRLVVWAYNHCAAFRCLNGHLDWVESVVVVRRREDPSTLQLYSAGSDGLVLQWMTASNNNNDLFTQEDELAGHEGSVLCIVYSEEMDLLVTGSEDLTIRIWELGVPKIKSAAEKGAEEDSSVDSCVLVGHTARITALACCSDQVLASVSHDKSLRFWDLHTRHEIDVVENAHGTPIHSLEYCECREELATAAHETTAKVWCSFKHSLKYVLGGHTRDVTQVRWCPFKNCWVTACDDELIRLFDTDGVEMSRFVFKGESVTTMYMDCKHELLVCAMVDRAIRAYDIETGDLVRKYSGHGDLVRQLAQVEERGQYLSCSWDKSIRIWWAPKGKGLEARAPDRAAVQEMQTEEESEDAVYVSNYEKEHPLVMPKTLKLGSKMVVRKQRKQQEKEVVEVEKDVEDLTGIGRRLKELDDTLRNELERELRSANSAPTPSSAGAGGTGRRTGRTGAGATKRR